MRSGEIYMKDTEHVPDEIRNIKLEEHKAMASFDIPDIFPFLPKQDVIAKVFGRINDKNFKISVNNEGCFVWSFVGNYF